jgi:hypothetical protein
MIKVPSYNKDNRKKPTYFSQLPKGAYVCKILHIEERESKKGNPMIVFQFDIAEGEYKDFYKKQYAANENEDKQWSFDATYYLNVPYEGCKPFLTEQWDTFWANIEDSNNGYVFDGNEKKIVGKTFGGVFRIEQTEANNGNIYDHTRLAYTTVSQDVRDGKVTKLPKDKLVGNEPIDTDAFVNVTSDTAEDLPWK